MIYFFEMHDECSKCDDRDDLDEFDDDDFDKSCDKIDSRHQMKVYIPHNYQYLSDDKKEAYAKKYKLSRDEFEKRYVNDYVDTTLVLNDNTENIMSLQHSVILPQHSAILPNTNTSIPNANTSIPNANTSIPNTNTSIPDASASIPFTLSMSQILNVSPLDSETSSNSDDVDSLD